MKPSSSFDRAGRAAKPLCLGPATLTKSTNTESMALYFNQFYFDFFFLLAHLVRSFVISIFWSSSCKSLCWEHIVGCCKWGDQGWCFFWFYLRLVRIERTPNCCPLCSTRDDATLRRPPKGRCPVRRRFTFKRQSLRDLFKTPQCSGILMINVVWNYFSRFT